ncbi:Proton-coupled amino acid transporter 4 [Dissostichus eleginoides]|uniref:Proton-coupled amino acid transporter 4 n=1 Tax=Dissostichus eleginoides TaxID=100907 RepID=A0AAD9CPE2_DISEL|nr:Proton-coupled amino acid transporter 4 [Dissostichus eleginoides]
MINITCSLVFAYRSGLNMLAGRVQYRGEIICLEMVDEKHQPSSPLCSVEVSVALTTTLHAHQTSIYSLDLHRYMLSFDPVILIHFQNRVSVSDPVLLSDRGKSL